MQQLQPQPDMPGDLTLNRLVLKVTYKMFPHEDGTLH